MKTTNVITNSKSYTKIILIWGATIILVSSLIALAFWWNLANTTQPKIEFHQPVKRVDGLNYLGGTGSENMRLPAKRAIVMRSKVKKKCEKDLCNFDSIPSSFYQVSEDVKENYIIGTDGTVFEARMVNFSGQMTYDRLRTAYNQGSIEINLVHYESEKITDSQISMLKGFLQYAVKKGHLSDEFKLYYHNQLINEEIDKDFYKILKWLWIHFKPFQRHQLTSFEDFYNLEVEVASKVLTSYNHKFNYCRM